MSKNLVENEQENLNSLGILVSPHKIQKNKLYLAYSITNGFVDIIFLWDSSKNANTGFSMINFKNRKRPKTIQLTSYNKGKLLKSLLKFNHLNSLYFKDFFNFTDNLESIGELRHLKKLSIINRSPINFPNLGKITKLIEVRITIYEKPFHFSDSLKNLQNIEKFHIGTDLNKFPDFVLNFEELKQLSLASNSIHSIPPSIGNLRNLQKLNLNNNKLSSLPHSIENLKILTHLNIGRNNFTKIPEYIKNLKKLKSIDISYNPFISLESFKYLFSNPNLAITSRFDIPSKFKLTIGGLEIPKKIKDYWYARNYEKIIQYYSPPITEIAQKYVKNPKSLTKHEFKRLIGESTKEERDILELSLPKNDPILIIINERLKIKLKNGFGLMR